MAHEKLLTVVEAAELLNTGERFVRRLIEERRIEFVRLGRKIRIPASSLDEMIDGGRVQAVRSGRAA